MSLTDKRLAGAGDDKMDAVDRRRKEVQSKLRGMIREAVRTKLGLLNEGNFVGNTVSKEGRSLQVSVTDGKISGSTSSNVEDEVLIGMEIYDAPVPNTLELDDRVAFWDAELLTETLRLGVFTYPTADAILALRPPSLYTMVVRFGTFDTATSTSVGTVRLVTSFQFDSNDAPTETTTAAAATPPAATAAATPPAATAAATPPAADVIEPVATPQQASMSVQDKIRKGAKAVQRDFEDVVESGIINLQDVSGQNQWQGHTWAENTHRSRGEKLSDWSTGEGYDDKYTYYALVSDATGLPVAFVVASDPEDNDHFSTGRFIGPNSTKPNLRKAFCVLYHRATGEVHESCDDGPTTGTEDDVPGGRRGGKSKGGAESGGDSKGAAAGVGDGARKINIRKGEATSGRGDMVSGLAGIKSPKEKMRQRGKVFITKSHTKAGFKDFPKRDVKLSAVLSIRVKFKHPMGIVSDANGYRSQVKFGANTGPRDIVLIQLSGAWGTVWALHQDKKKLEPGDVDFEAAAKWVFANQKQFDLASEDTMIEDADSTGTAAAAGVRPADNTGEVMAESRRRPSLMDLYRF